MCDSESASDKLGSSTSQLQLSAPPLQILLGYFLLHRELLLANILWRHFQVPKLIVCKWMHFTFKFVNLSIHYSITIDGMCAVGSLISMMHVWHSISFLCCSCSQFWVLHISGLGSIFHIVALYGLHDENHCVIELCLQIWNTRFELNWCTALHSFNQRHDEIVSISICMIKLVTQVYSSFSFFFF